MKAAPSASLEVSEANLLLEFLIVALDAPAQFGGIDQIDKRDGLWKRGEPVFGRCGLAFGPLNQQPFFLWLFGLSLLGATATLTRAKREDNQSFVPSRHLIVRHAFAGNLRASFLTETAL